MKIFCDDCGERKRRGACWQKDERVEWIERLSEKYAINRTMLCGFITEFILNEEMVERICQISTETGRSLKDVWLDSVKVASILSEGPTYNTGKASRIKYSHGKFILK